MGVSKGDKRMKHMKFPTILAVLAVLGLILATQALAQIQPQQPPEYKDVVAASRIQDLAAKLKELERIKAAYPNSQYIATIDGWILAAKIDLADTLDAILDLQKDFLAKAKGPDRVQGPFMAADQIVSHPKALAFDKAKVLAAVLAYKEAVTKALGEAESLQGIPPDQQKSFKTYFQSGVDIFVAQAQMYAGDAAKALASLESYRAAGGTADGQYSFVEAQANAKLGKTKEAYEGFVRAAIENYPNAADNAKALYTKLNGKADGFEAALEAKMKELPFHPEPFKPGAAWKGKAVLAEIFTGSECPPCVGADLAFDGLIEAYPVKYVAVLEYHLPIPRPDPIMNPATKKRQDYYAVNSTPTAIIDGEKKIVGGGSRGMAEAKFKDYKAEVDARLNAAPAVVLGVKATRTGDVVKVDCTVDKAAPGVEYNVVLVQSEEKYKGSNGIVFHKLVVRDLAVLDPAGAKTASFDLAASEQAADAYLTDFEKTSTRFPSFKFPERHAKIDRTKLRVVFFAQEKESKKVLNAVVADIK
jgi:thiol-disulfide isomerase/thioredoxin